MSTLVWLHEDRLRANDPALAANPGSPSVFVWDDTRLRAEGYTLKRVAFVYECLLETPARILRGDTVSTLLAAVGDAGADRIATTESVNPHFAECVDALQRKTEVAIVLPDSLVPLDLDADLRRFARFWKKAEPYAFGRKG